MPLTPHARPASPLRHFAPSTPPNLLTRPPRVKSEGDSVVTLRTNQDVPLADPAHYSPYLFCHFGAVTVPASLATAETLSCAAPAHAPGYVTVELTVNGQDYTTTGQQVHLVQVMIHAIQPANGPRLGGTRVVISGQNLLDVFTCMFASRVAASTQTHGRGRFACTTAAFASTGWVALELVEGNRTLSSSTPQPRTLQPPNLSATSLAPTTTPDPHPTLPALPAASMFHVDDYIYVSAATPQLGPVQGEQRPE